MSPIQGSLGVYFVLAVPVNGRESFNQSGMRVVQRRVEGVGNKRQFVSRVNSNQALFQILPMAVVHCKLVSSKHRLSLEGHCDEGGHELHWNVQVLEEEQVEEVRSVRESKREQDLLVSHAEAEEPKENKQLD